MKLTQISCKNFRNIIDETIFPSESVNFICGNNAQGKTNLIEAIWLFTGEKSFRGSKDLELINFNNQNEITSLYVKYESFERENDSSILFQNGKRKIKINGVDKKGTSALIGKFCAVIFSPEHLSLVKGSPILRRSFIDNAICQIKPLYSKTLYQYDHTLFQRNSLLKDILKHPELRDTIDIWDERLAFYGSKIVEQRLLYIEKLKDYAKKSYFDISNQNEIFDISYQSAVDIKKENLYEEMILKYKENVKEDILNGFTCLGPHRDDLEITINNVSARSFASQGQQRSAVLSLKFAEAEILSETLGEKPVLLLDDVLSELDDKRQEYIFNNIEGFQVFITGCDIEKSSMLKNGNVFYVENGKFKKD